MEDENDYKDRITDNEQNKKIRDKKLNQQREDVRNEQRKNVRSNSIKNKLKLQEQQIKNLTPPRDNKEEQKRNEIPRHTRSTSYYNEPEFVQQIDDKYNIKLKELKDLYKQNKILINRNYSKDNDKLIEELKKLDEQYKNNKKKILKDKQNEMSNMQKKYPNKKK